MNGQDRSDMAVALAHIARIEERRRASPSLTISIANAIFELGGACEATLRQEVLDAAVDYFAALERVQ